MVFPMRSMLIRQAGLALVIAASVAAMVGCLSSGDNRLARMARAAAEEEAARARQALAHARFAPAMANAKEKIVVRDQRFDIDPQDVSARQGITGIVLPGSDASSGSAEVMTSQSSQDDGYVTSSLPWRNDTGHPEFYVELAP